MKNDSDSPEHRHMSKTGDSGCKRFMAQLKASPLGLTDY